MNLALVALLAGSQASAAGQQSQAMAGRVDRETSKGKTIAKNQPKEDTNRGPSKADDEAARLRRILPVLPALIRGNDGLLHAFGQRATQNLFVSSTNVKDPAIDSFPIAGGLPAEAAEPVQVPAEQFTVSLAKFYATVPSLDPISSSGWHFSFGSPMLSLRHGGDGVRGFRSATPTASATGPLLGDKLSLFQSFGYRLSKTTVENLWGEHHDSKFQSYDSNSHADIKALRAHELSGRFALFSQDIDFATLTALMSPESTPSYLMRGGQLYLSDAYTIDGGAILDSSVAVRRLRLRVLPRGSEPMVLVEQGETLGNYFDTLRRASSRVEWKEALRLPERNAWGQHRVSFGGGLARSSFESSRLGNAIILRSSEESEAAGGDEEGVVSQTSDEGESISKTVFSITRFTGTPRESLSSKELTGWAEDRWAPTRRVSFTAGLKYEWTTLSRNNQWAPRLGFALLPFRSDRSVIRGGLGVFYDILPLAVGTFTRSRQRLVEFFSEGEAIAEPRALTNVLAKSRLRTPHVLGWNLELDQQVTGSLFVRLKAEDRRGKDLTLINPDHSGTSVTALVLSDDGTSRYRELEATASFRPNKWSVMNASYVRSSSVGDLNTFTATMAVFEKLALGKNQYAHSRSDSPHRFLGWGEVRAPLKVMVSPALDLHSGLPFGFTDADNTIPGKADFGRYPRMFTLDLGLHRDIDVRPLDRLGKLRLGLRVYNLTNHFNPRDVELGDLHTETVSRPILKGFANGAGRSYRASVMLDF